MLWMDVMIAPRAICITLGQDYGLVSSIFRPQLVQVFAIPHVQVYSPTISSPPPSLLSLYQTFNPLASCDIQAGWPSDSARLSTTEALVTASRIPSLLGSQPREPNPERTARSLLEV